MLGSAEIRGFDRRGGVWHAWDGRPVGVLAELLDYNKAGPGDTADEREGSMLCAPLVTREGSVRRPEGRRTPSGPARPFDAELVEHFRSQAAVAIQNLQRTESLQARMLTAERKHAMAELARSVSHDVNNALGSMLPLIQQLQTDLQSGKMDVPVFSSRSRAGPEVAAGLPAHLRRHALVRTRRGATRGRSGQVQPALETTLAVLKDGMRAARHQPRDRAAGRSASGGVRAERSGAGASSIC